jgi:hypothetical protein
LVAEGRRSAGHIPPHVTGTQQASAQGRVCLCFGKAAGCRYGAGVAGAVPGATWVTVPP